MDKPTKKSFYDYMSIKYNVKYKDKETYELLLETIEQASSNDEILYGLIDLLSMSKVDRLIYRNSLAESGKELTPKQVDMYLSMIEYALDHVH
jgi:hypothetical protein